MASIWITYGELKDLIHEAIELDIDCAICKMAGKKHPHMEEGDELEERKKNPYWGADKSKEKSGGGGHPFWGKTKDKEELKNEIDEDGEEPEWGKPEKRPWGEEEPEHLPGDFPPTPTQASRERLRRQQRGEELYDVHVIETDEDDGYEEW